MLRTGRAKKTLLNTAPGYHALHQVFKKNSAKLKNLPGLFCHSKTICKLGL